jgi:caffeoyl-CoA O-methyltransferase
MPIEPFAPELSEYLDELVRDRAAELRAMEAKAAKTRFPIVGPAAGQFCYWLTRLVGARAVFEMGSGYGYSTAWFARAVRENGGGVVHHTVWDEQLSAQAREHLSALGLIDLVQFHVAEAVQILRESGEQFDVIFNDILKRGYPAALPVIKAHLRPGGVLISDNMLWHGAIFDDGDRSEDTQGIREFTQLMTTDPDWISSLVPIRDGMLVSRRR